MERQIHSDRKIEEKEKQTDTDRKIVERQTHSERKIEKTDRQTDRGTGSE